MTTNPTRRHPGGQGAPPTRALGQPSQVGHLSSWKRVVSHSGARPTVQGTPSPASPQPPGIPRSLQTLKRQKDRQKTARGRTQGQGPGQAAAHQLDRRRSGLGRAPRRSSANGPPPAPWGPFIRGCRPGPSPPRGGRRLRPGSAERGRPAPPALRQARGSGPARPGSPQPGSAGSRAAVPWGARRRGRLPQGTDGVPLWSQFSPLPSG